MPMTYFFKNILQVRHILYLLMSYLCFMKKILFISIITLSAIFHLSAQNVAGGVVKNAQYENLKSHLYYLASDSLQGRATGTDGNRAAAEYICERFAEIGLKPFKENSFISEHKYHGDRIARNVIALLEGSDPHLKSQYIVVGAHYDHLPVKYGDSNEDNIYNGADDNASGVSSLIEIARNIQSMSPPKRSILFVAFDAEEIGLVGSSLMVRDSLPPHSQINSMLSIDMVGWYSTSEYLQLTGLATISNYEELLIMANEEYAYGGIRKPLNIKEKLFETSIMGATDTQPYAEVGIPTLYVTTGLESPYHKVGDHADLIDYEGLNNITDYLAFLIYEMADNEQFTSSGKISEIHKPKFSKLSFGFTFAAGHSKFNYPEGAFNGKPAFDLNLGLSLNYRVGSWNFNPELLFDMPNVKYAEHLESKDNLNLSLYSLLIPLNIKYDFPSVMDSPFGVSFFISPYYRHIFGARNSNEEFSFHNNFKNYDYGIGFGIGFRFGNLLIESRHLNGFNSISRGQNPIKIVANTLSFSYFL